MDEMLFAEEVPSWEIGILSLLDPRSNLLAAWGLGAASSTTVVAKYNSETVFVPEAPSCFP